MKLKRKNIARSSAIVDVYFSLAIIKKTVYSAHQQSFEDEEKIQLAPNRPEERTHINRVGEKTSPSFFLTLGYFGRQFFMGSNAYVLRKMPSYWTALEVLHYVRFQRQRNVCLLDLFDFDACHLHSRTNSQNHNYRSFDEIVKSALNCTSQAICDARSAVLTWLLALV